MNDFSGSRPPLLAEHREQNHNISTQNVSFRQAPLACRVRTRANTVFGGIERRSHECERCTRGRVRHIKIARLFFGRALSSTGLINATTE